MGNEIVLPGVAEIARIETLDTIRKLLDIGEIMGRYKLSIPQTVELTRQRGYLVIRAGELYDGLGDERSIRGPGRSLTDLTTKQQAEREIDKSRPTIMKWVRMARNGAYGKVDEYCDSCLQNTKISEATLHNLYQYFAGIPVDKFTGNQENYTPEYIIEAARSVMGSIDLDPASCEVAQEIVGADEYYTAEDNGLEQDWYGNVFLNPPYTRGLIEQFVAKLIEELPKIKAAILLTNNNTDTQWCVLAAEKASAICFTTGRIHFYTPEKELTQPTNGQMLFYFGSEYKVFKEIFSEIGWVRYDK